MNRRSLILGLIPGILIAPGAGQAQQASETRRIGYLGLNSLPEVQHLLEPFRQGLRQHGWNEDRNITIEYRFAHGKQDRLRELADELVRAKVDVIVAGGGTLGALAAKQATRTIPIVFPVVGDPISEGLVTSLARPGGNVTGLSALNSALIPKHLELLKQAVPGVGRVALLLKPDSVPARTKKDMLAAADVAAKALGVQLQVVEAQGPEDFDRAFSDMTGARAGALTVLATPAFDRGRLRLVGLAAKHRLPTVYSFGQYVDAGGLMSYGTDLADLFRRAATYVDKILKGAKPADLPVEQPTKFEFVINLKTAKALGLTIPQSLLLRADQVIQ